MSNPTIWRYAVSNADDGTDCGGVFIIASDGYFSCITDWGNYAFKWSAFGDDFRKFLCKLNADYLLNKLAHHTMRYDPKATRMRIKQCILDMRRDGTLDKDDARREFNLLREHSDVENEYWFGSWYHATTIADANDLQVESYGGDALGLVHKLWPRFVRLLGADLVPKAVPLSPPYEEHKNP